MCGCCRPICAWRARRLCAPAKKVDLEATNQGQEYDWIGGSRFLPAGITLAMSRPFVVYPDGSVDAPPIVMSLGRRQDTLTVNPVTGGVTVASP